MEDILKYPKVFLFWFFVTVVVRGVLMVIVDPIYAELEVSKDAATSIDTLLTVTVAVGIGLWTRRKLQSGFFGD